MNSEMGEDIEIVGGWVPSNPFERCAVCGCEERHMTTKREGWESKTAGDEGQYELICPDCQDPPAPGRDADPCHTLDVFLDGDEVSNSGGGDV